MKFVFLDDSVQKNPPRQGLGDLVALGGVIVPEEHVTGYADDLLDIKQRLGIPAADEIKWKPAKNTVLASAGGQVVTKFRESMLEAAIAREITSVVLVLDHGRVFKDLTVVEVGQKLLEWTYDKVAFGLGGQQAVMIADKPGGGSADESRWLAQTLALTNDGTEYTAPGQVILPVLTAGSHHVPHLQLADLVTAATTAAIAGRPGGLRLAPLLHQLARRNAVGYAGGAGVTLWPPDLVDLHYWVFGEDTYAKGNTGHPLGPSNAPTGGSGRPFQLGDGMSQTK